MLPVRMPLPLAIHETLDGAGGADGPGMLWMLLEFVSALERALFNAFDGCCSCAPVADKTSSFFHTNRKVTILPSTVGGQKLLVKVLTCPTGLINHDDDDDHHYDQESTSCAYMAVAVSSQGKPKDMLFVSGPLLLASLLHCLNTLKASRPTRHKRNWCRRQRKGSAICLRSNLASCVASPLPMHATSCISNLSCCSSLKAQYTK